MILHPPPSRTLQAVLIALAVATAGGCALNRLPRIDPTGQRLFVPPSQAAPIPALPAASAAPTLAPGAAGGLPATPPNVVAPPAYTDPYLPGGPQPATATTDWLGRPVVVGPPVATVPGQPVAGPAAVPSVPGEALSITPSRILAPVGSEVILVGGVCAENGRLRTNERVEWMLDRAGTGQFVTVGGRGELDMFRWPTNTPRKVDNFFAIGSTSPYNECLDRGTPDPSDDVQIRRGDAWITVTSPTEGTSYVTAYAPDVPNWAGRTARATIYWVDALWSFPPPVTLAPGESHTLTTTVTRQSDGAPIPGWIVRYRVVGDGASLDYSQGQTSDVPTNAQGRASVSIAPTDDRPGTTNVQIEIVRPEQVGNAASPRVTLATGATSISWAAGGISGSPLPATQPPMLEPTPDDGWTNPNPQPTPAPTPTPTPRPEPTPQPAGRPDLVLRVDQLTPGTTFGVGDQIDYKITLVNEGNGTARNVKIVDEFDLGLTNDFAERGVQEISTSDFFDLVPGESFTLDVTFRVTQPGGLSHNVTATADNATPQYERMFISAEGGTGGAVGGIEPQVQVTLVVPPRKTVGDTALFRVVVRNRGNVPATNLTVTTQFDQELKPQQASKPYDQAHYLSTGQIRWQIPRLEPASEIVQEVLAECVTASRSTCVDVEVSADALGEPKFDRQCLEIRPQLGGAGPTAPQPGGQNPATTPPAGGLDAVIAELSAPRQGQRTVVYVTVDNNTGLPQRNVVVRMLVPAELKPDLQSIKTDIPMQSNTWVDGRTELTFGPIAEMPAGGRQSFTLPVEAMTPGSGQFHVETRSQSLGGVDKAKDISVIPR